MTLRALEVKGVDQFARSMGRAIGQIDTLENGGRAAADAIATRARAEAPRLTGALAASVYGQVRGDTMEVGTTVRYGWPVHQGVPTHNQPPNPFLRRAAEAVRWVDMYDKDIEQAMSQVEGV